MKQHTPHHAHLLGTSIGNLELAVAWFKSTWFNEEPYITKVPSWSKKTNSILSTSGGVHEFRSKLLASSTIFAAEPELHDIDTT